MLTKEERAAIRARAERYIASLDGQVSDEEWECARGAFLSQAPATLAILDALDAETARADAAEAELARLVEVLKECSESFLNIKEKIMYLDTDSQIDAICDDAACGIRAALNASAAKEA